MEIYIIYAMLSGICFGLAQWSGYAASSENGSPLLFSIAALLNGASFCCMIRAISFLIK